MQQELTREWVVMKFGGTSVSSVENWETIARLVQARLDAGLLREAWRLQGHHWDRLAHACKSLASLPLHIDDAADVTPAELKARVRAFANKHGQPSLVAVDYLQRLSSPDTGTANRAERVGQGSWACKSIANTRSAPARVIKLATSLAVIGTRPSSLRSCRA